MFIPCKGIVFWFFCFCCSSWGRGVNGAQRVFSPLWHLSTPARLPEGKTSWNCSVTTEQTNWNCSVTRGQTNWNCSVTRGQTNWNCSVTRGQTNWNCSVTRGQTNWNCSVTRGQNQLKLLGYQRANQLKLLGYQRANQLKLLGYQRANQLKLLDYQRANQLKLIDASLTRVKRSIFKIAIRISLKSTFENGFYSWCSTQPWIYLSHWLINSVWSIFPWTVDWLVVQDYLPLKLSLQL